ncbi:MAG: energy-coupling factor ABC transporter permease [Gammaproteobacteria bacterium]|nr:energy-coupling factor ABC transporter permease [Gammaproteobacteria bacterium]
MNLDINWLIGLHIPSGLLPGWLLLAGNALFLLCLLIASFCAPWKGLVQKQESQHVFLGAIVMLLTIWGIKAGISPGLGFHHLGATLFTLMFGWPLAIVGLTLTMLASLLLQASDWASLGINGLLSIIIPIAVSYSILKLSQKWLPDNFFIYIFICAFFGAGIAIAVSRLSAITLLSAMHAYPDEQLIEESLQYIPLFMFPEAFVTGMLISIFVVYRPDWVATFDDERYIRGK